MAGRWRRRALRARGVSAWDASEDVLRTLVAQVVEDALLVLSRGPLVPFVVVESGESATLHRFEQGTDAARAWLAEQPAGVDRAVLVHAARVPVAGEEHDAVLVEAHERGARASATVGQRFARLPGAEPDRVGPPFDAGDAAPLLS